MSTLSCMPSLNDLLAKKRRLVEKLALSWNFTNEHYVQISKAKIYKTSNVKERIEKYN